MEKLLKYEKKIIQELKQKGYTYKDSNDIYRQNEIDIKVVNIILKWLPDIYTEHFGTADILVRSLISAKEAFNPSLLIKLFDESELNFSLKSGIAYALVYAKTDDISGWIRDQLLNKDYSLERSVLVEGLNNKGKFSDVRELMSFLRKIFEKYHNEEVLKLFKEFGDERDIMFLKEKVVTSDVKMSKQLGKTITAILKRLE